MPNKLQRRRPELESLEGRTLLSAAAQRDLFNGSKALALLDVGRSSTSLVRSAKALSSTEVLVRLSRPVSSDALDAARLTIRRLNVRSVQLASDERSLVLTTSPQQGRKYTVRLGDSPVATFQGKNASRGIIRNATSLGSTEVLISFKSKVGAAVADPSLYSIPGLSVTGARLNPFRTGVVLQTSPQEDRIYSLQMAGARKGAGELSIKAVAGVIASALFEGDGKVPTRPELPWVVSAVSVSNTEVLVQFSEPMGSDALQPLHYEIAPAGGNAQAGLLQVLSVVWAREDHSAVVLTTRSQSAVPYVVTVTNVHDAAPKNEPLANSSGKPTDPTRALFNGRPPSGTQLVDTDLDGITDDVEQRGWTVTIVLGNGTIVQREVTSDPTLADTDGDGVPDDDELAARSDPRDADTDDDGIPDLVELQDGAGDPTKQDTDGDGLTDLAERTGWTINITLGDGSVVTQHVTSNPFLADTDFDGLLDRLEQIVGVNPRNPDSDGDGATDGQEVNAGKDPTTHHPDDISAATDPKDLPRVTGAASQSNTSLLVSFSKPMDASALNPGHYIIVQTNVNPEPGVLLLADGDDIFEFGGFEDRDLNGDGVLDPTPDIEWANAEHTAVLLTTFPQNELTYTVTVVNVRDTGGNPLAPPVPVAGRLINLSSLDFPGTPQSGGQADSDGDGLTDNVEMRGWFVTVQLIDGTTTNRGVTSDPGNPDTDGDGLNDAQEANLRFDPRAVDTDDDQLSDFAEFNELFSNGLDQDTDGDGLDDFVEWTFFNTSPIFADTDGDQLSDSDEILVSIRNPRVADLPAPDIEIGDIDLQLDVRFTESTATGRRELDSKSVSSTLQQSNKKEFSHSDSSTHQFSIKAGAEQKIEVGSLETSAEFTFSQEVGYTGGWSTSSTSTSAQETQRSYQDSLQTDVETTENGAVERQVAGARMQVALSLKSAGNLAFRVQNLLVTAFIQDPQDPSSLRPVASLRSEPGVEPADGFAVGPLVPERGPFIFTSETVFPNMVDSLMKNPRGLVFRLANFDIVDELGRNFAFTSQEIVERTGAVVFDFGGVDTDGDGEGDLTEYHRVATGTGREIDGNRVAFDVAGKPVGITLADAMTAIGLSRFEAREVGGEILEFEPGGDTPVSLTLEELQSSYSTILDESGIERLFRIRDVENQVSKNWVVLRPTGEIDSTVGFNDKILRSGADVRLAFVQDLDGDNLPASLEYLLNTIDTNADTDGDGLDDRIESLVGWSVDLGGRGTRRVTSAGYLDDSDLDGLTDAQEAPVLSRFVDLNGDGLLDRYDPTILVSGDFVTDPTNPDTDGDGVGRFLFVEPNSTEPRPSDDFAEVNGYIIASTFTNSGFIPDPTLHPGRLFVFTDPTREDTDGDGIVDGSEVRFGLDPEDDDDDDSDRDGLPDRIEEEGWIVTVFGVSTAPRVEGAASPNLRTSNPFDPDTDDDGLPDFVEYDLATDPRTEDSDGDGVTDIQEVQGVEVRNLGIVLLDPLDADLDDDLRSDGDEAELVDLESRRWFVFAEGKPALRVFSDPRFADGDADGLVDGEEFGDFTGDGILDPRVFFDSSGRPYNVGIYRTDPTNANTDGDRRIDGVEVVGGLNPLVEDFRVTVVAEYIDIDHDGDGGESATPAGEFEIFLGVRLPDEAGPAGLSDSATPVFSQLLAIDQDENGGLLPFRTIVPFEGPPGFARSLTFSLAAHQRFSIEGTIREIEGLNSGTDPYTEFEIGGLEGLRATKQVPDESEGNEGETRAELIRPVFSAEEVIDQSIEDLTFDFDSDRDPVNRVRGPGLNRIAGKLKIYYIIE
jgi:hypothetical protein